MDQLRAALPAARLARYERACANTATEPMALYLWASSVALAMFDDLSHLEVAMRSRMVDQLAATYGMQWFQRTDILDSDTLKLIKTAWRQGGLSQLNASADVVHGKLVASLMFGFWVKILGRGRRTALMDRLPLATTGRRIECEINEMAYRLGAVQKTNDANLLVLYSPPADDEAEAGLRLIEQYAHTIEVTSATAPEDVANALEVDLLPA